MQNMLRDLCSRRDLQTRRSSPLLRGSASMRRMSQPRGKNFFAGLHAHRRFAMTIAVDESRGHPCDPLSTPRKRLLSAAARSLINLWPGDLWRARTLRVPLAQIKPHLVGRTEAHLLIQRSEERRV